MIPSGPCQTSDGQRGTESGPKRFSGSEPVDPPLGGCGVLQVGAERHSFASATTGRLSRVSVPGKVAAALRTGESLG